jgi:6-phosphofructokinase 1
MKRIAVFTSGGDAPGMNACIRSVVRTAIYNGCEVVGIMRGYEGMIDDDMVELKAGSVANIIQRGGTILKTARSARFMELVWRQQAVKNLQHRNIDGIVAIGGDGTFRGAIALHELCAIPVMGCPGTIDNDLAGTDVTIGYETALNTVVEAVDKIRDTAESHDRVFIVEVMGRDSGLIALYSGIGSGAEGILIPECNNDLPQLLDNLEHSRSDKKSRIIIVAEGDDAGGGKQVADAIKSRFPGFDTRLSILGHMQRGGAPTCMERVNASLMGAAAVEGLLNGRSMEMVGIVKNAVSYTPFVDAVKQHIKPNPKLLKLAHVLSR